MLPVLHLNGYKIANPTVLARIPEAELVALLEGYGYRPVLVTGGFDGEDPLAVHERFAAALDEALDEIAEIKQRGDGARPRWPMIVLRTPKGWTGPKEVDGLPVENTWRSHQVPIAEARDNDEHRRLLEEWMRSYRPEELFDDNGAPVAELLELAPRDERRMSANPSANGGIAAPRPAAAGLPRLRRRRARAGQDAQRGDPGTGRLPPRRGRAEPGQLPRLRPRRDRVEPPRRHLRGHRRASGRQRSCRPTRTSPRAARWSKC